MWEEKLRGVTYPGMQLHLPVGSEPWCLFHFAQHSSLPLRLLGGRERRGQGRDLRPNCEIGFSLRGFLTPELIVDPSLNRGS